jgi:hypothetical protein
MAGWVKYLVDVQVDAAFVEQLGNELRKLDDVLVRFDASDSAARRLIELLSNSYARVWLRGSKDAVRAFVHETPRRPCVVSVVDEGGALAELEDVPSDVYPSDVEPLFRVERDGRIYVGSKRSRGPVWDDGIDACMSELGIEVTSDAIRIPTVMIARGPGDLVVPVVSISGSMASGDRFTQIEGRVAFGFENYAEFDEWIANASGIDPEHVRFPVWHHEIRTAPSRGEKMPFIALAKDILMNRREDARRSLGLDAASTSASAAKAAAHMLTSAIGVIVLSRHPLERRQKALRTFTRFGASHARDVAKFIDQVDPTLRAHRVTSSRAHRDKLKAVIANRGLLLRQVEDTLETLLQLFA